MSMYRTSQGHPEGSILGLRFSSTIYSWLVCLLYYPRTKIRLTVLLLIKFNLKKPKKAGGIGPVTQACFSIKWIDSYASIQK